MLVEPQVVELRKKTLKLEEDTEKINKTLYTKESVSVEDNNIKLENTEEGLDLKILEVDSNKLEQKSYKGYNLLNIPSEITIDGFQDITCELKAGTYILSFGSRETSVSVSSLINFRSNNTSIASVNITNNSKEFELPSDIDIVRIYSANTAAASSGVETTITNLMIRKSTVTDDVYEPYVRSDKPHLAQTTHKR